MPYDASGMGFGPMGQNTTPWGLENAVDTSAADMATQQSAAAQAGTQYRRNRLLELAEQAQVQRKQHFDFEASRLAKLRDSPIGQPSSAGPSYQNEEAEQRQKDYDAAIASLRSKYRIF